jgi:hypothetical protein
MKKAAGVTNDYQIRPKQREKFKAAEAREVIRAVLKEKLELVAADADLAILGRQIADRVKYQLKELGKGRYKYVVQVALGQQKGQGVQAGTRCFWDFETDAVAYEQYLTDNLFCLVTAYGVYLY